MSPPGVSYYRQGAAAVTSQQEIPLKVDIKRIRLNLVQTVPPKAINGGRIARLLKAFVAGVDTPGKFRNSVEELGKRCLPLKLPAKFKKTKINGIFFQLSFCLLLICQVS